MWNKIDVDFCLCMKNSDEKLGKYEEYNCKEAFIKIFRKSIFSLAKNTPSNANKFSKCVFFAEKKGPQNWDTLLRKSSFCSSLIIFMLTFKFSDSGIIALGFCSSSNEKVSYRGC